MGVPPEMRTRNRKKKYKSKVPHSIPEFKRHSSFKLNEKDIDLDVYLRLVTYQKLDPAILISFDDTISPSLAHCHKRPQFY